MPSVTTNFVPSSWADEVERGEEIHLPSPITEIDEENQTKTITVFKINEDGKRVKTVRTYKLDIRKMPKSIAMRKTWKKFGAALNDPPGPNPANTIIAEETFIVLVNNKDNNQVVDDPDDALAKIKDRGQKMVSCRICKGDHWTTKCPYKDSLVPQNTEGEQNSQDEKSKPSTSSGVSSGSNSVLGTTGGKYVAPGRRGGTDTKFSTGERMGSGRDEAATIRVTNLSEDTTESDLQDLFKPFGYIHRIFLAKDKITGQSKGYAFINYSRKEEAAKAIKNLQGYGYDHLILNVEWAKPSAVN